MLLNIQEHPEKKSSYNYFIEDCNAPVRFKLSKENNVENFVKQAHPVSFEIEFQIKWTYHDGTIGIRDRDGRDHYLSASSATKVFSNFHEKNERMIKVVSNGERWLRARFMPVKRTSYVYLTLYGELAS